MHKATKNILSAMYAAYLIAASKAAQENKAHVFRIDLVGGDQLFFATSTTPALIGWGDAEARMPKTKKVAALRHIATVESL